MVATHPTRPGDLRRVRSHDWRDGAEGLLAVCRSCGDAMSIATPLRRLRWCPGPPVVVQCVFGLIGKAFVDSERESLVFVCKIDHSHRHSLEGCLFPIHRSNPIGSVEVFVPTRIWRAMTTRRVDS